MREMGLLRVQKRRKGFTTDSKHGFRRYPNLVADLDVSYPDQVWVSDITYIRLHTGFVYLAVIMDIFTRTIRGWQLSRWLDRSLTLVALQRAFSTHVAHIHHSDQGVQYAANDYTDLLKEYHVQISMAHKGSPEENAYAERLSAPSRKRRWIYLNTKPLEMPWARLDTSLMRSIRRSVSTHLWDT